MPLAKKLYYKVALGLSAHTHTHRQAQGTCTSPAGSSCSFSCCCYCCCCVWCRCTFNRFRQFSLFLALLHTCSSLHNSVSHPATWSSALRPPSAPRERVSLALSLPRAESQWTRNCATQCAQWYNKKKLH